MSSAAVASKAAPYLVSRRALQRLTQKYPQYLKETIKQQGKKDDSTSWPRSMQIAGYAAVALSIPYTMIIIVAESPRVRDYLEGDPLLLTGNNGNNSDSDCNSIPAVTNGQKFVNFVRWYWGHEDDIPYSEYLEKMDHEEVSLTSDVSTSDRVMEAGIQSMIHDDIRVRVNADGGDDVDHVGTVSGDVLLSNIDAIWKGVGGGGMSSTATDGTNATHGNVRPSGLSFEDNDSDSPSSSPLEENSSASTSTSTTISFTDTVDDGTSSLEARVLDNPKSITSYINIWSAWHTFDAGSVTNDATKGKSAGAIMSREQIEVEELKYKIEELLKDIRDPKCTRDIDDMNAELAELKRKYRAKWRVRNMAKLKNMLRSS